MTTATLPQFSQIKPETIEAELDQLLAENRARIAALVANPTAINSWETLVEPLNDLDERLDQFWSPIQHLHSVKQSPALRDAYNACLPKLTEYGTELEQNEKLYAAFDALANSAAYKKLNSAQQKVIQNQLRDFRLAGVHLAPDAKKSYAEIETELAKLQTQFSENVLDATASWSYHVTDETELRGIPPHMLALTQEAAKAKGLTGWLLTLDFPCYFAVVSHADNRQLREKIYTAYVTRASDLGDAKLDNTPIMAEILRLRHELSLLLGFHNFAELSVATKMVEEPKEVLKFLQELVQHARPRAQQELQELTQFAQTQDAIETLQPWDITYYSEKLREQKYLISDAILRPYFPIDQVLQGMFELVERLYNMQVREVKDIDVWHKDVRFFSIYDQHAQLRGQFYLDLYARPQKREGAWMDDCRQRRRVNGELQTPIAYLTCNFTPAGQNEPALLTFEEVLTLFHEFGHGLQHMLTQIDYPDVSGINGVAWDAVELPSQFMEFFVREQAVLQFISAHHQTENPLPDELYERLHAAKHFHTGLHILRQLEFALFDLELHLNYDPSKNAAQIQQQLDAVRSAITVVPIASFNRFQNTFSHIFAGGYAAGYYSYLWAEILASDAFAKFEENGIFDPATGEAFLKTILEQGGAVDALDLFIAFRGRAPTPDAFLRHQGFE